MQWLLYTQIKSSDSKRRLEAIEKLSAVHEEKAMLAVAGALSDRSPQVRVAAAAALGRFKEERLLRPLLAALQDPHPKVRETAAISIKQIAHPAAAPYLAPLLADPDGGVRTAASQALDALGWMPQTELEQAVHAVGKGALGKAAALGSVAVPALMAVLADPSSSRRRDAVDALRDFREPQVVQAILRMLEDPDAGVRISALGAMARMGDESHAAAIIARLQDPDKNVRACAVEGVVSIGCKDAISLVIEKLKDMEWVVRVTAASVLARLKARESLTHLAAALGDPDIDVREAIVDAIGRIGDPRGIELLVMAQLDPESRVRQAAASAAARIDSQWHRTEQARQTLHALKRALKHQNYWVRQSAAELLNRIFNMRQWSPLAAPGTDAVTRKRHELLEILSLTLWDDDPLLRFAAVCAMSDLGDKKAIEPLTARADDQDPWVRHAAVDLLGRLRGNGDDRYVAGAGAGVSPEGWGSPGLG